jgi:predicted dehydrogenase
VARDARRSGRTGRTRTIGRGLMVRFAVVGLGWWGRHLVAKLSGGPSTTVVLTVDTDPAAGADTVDLEEALRDPSVDAVALCLPHADHEQAIVRCAAAGKHVFCEKPLTLTAASARRAVDACQAVGVVLGVGHERRFEDPWRAVTTAVAAGELGVVLHAEAALSHDRFRALDPTHWRGSAAHAPAAGMTGMGVHLTDILIAMLGAVDEVHASAAQRVLPLPSGDVVSVQLRFRSGAIGSVSAVSATPFYGRLAVFGSEAWIEVRDDDHPEAAAGAVVTRCGRDGMPRSEHVAGATDAVLANLQAFAAAIEGGAPYPFSAAELIHNVAVLEATARSARDGVPVAMTGELAWTG